MINSFSPYGIGKVVSGIYTTSSPNTYFYFLHIDFIASLQDFKTRIAAPGLGVASTLSLVSEDQQYAYFLIAVQNDNLFYKLDFQTLEAAGQILIQLLKGSQSIGLQEAGQYIILMYQDNGGTQWIDLYDIATSTITKTFEITISIHRITSYVIDGDKYTLLAGNTGATDNFFVAKVYANNFHQINVLALNSSAWQNLAPGSLNIEVSTPSDTGSFSTISAAVNSPPYSPLINHGTQSTAFVSSGIFYHTALWDDDFTQTVRAGENTTLDFNWACSNPSNVTSMSFAIISIESSPVPAWVELDSTSQTLTLANPSQSGEIGSYKFGLEISHEAEVDVKNFYITVEKCQIEG